MQNTQRIFKIVVVKIPRISVFRSFTYFLFLSWSFGIVLWEVATIGMYKLKFLTATEERFFLAFGLKCLTFAVKKVLTRNHA